MGVIRYKNFIYANSQLIAIHIEEDDGNMVLPQNRYMHKDALGSIDTITDESGVVVKRMSYKPFGEQIEQEWINEASKNLGTKRGFTGHEHIKEFGLIHMNGRVYDPTTGRFLSADPNIQAPYDTQSYNRYTYVKNNPLKYTDPSGFFFKKLFKAIGKVFKAIKKYIKVIVAIVVTIIIVYFTAGAGAAMIGKAWAAFFSGFGGAMMSGAIAGFASGFIMTGTLSGAVKGAIFGAISAGVAYGIGNYIEGAKYLKTAFAKEGLRAVLHGISRAAITKAQGGRWSSGFWSGLAGSAIGTVMRGLNEVRFEIKTAISAIGSGLISKVSGGKFANGAVTGAFTYLFNEMLHDGLMNKAFGNPKNHPMEKILSWVKENKATIINVLKTTYTYSDYLSTGSILLGNAPAAATFIGISIGARVLEVLVANDFNTNGQALDYALLKATTHKLPEPLGSMLEVGLRYTREQLPKLGVN